METMFASPLIFKQKLMRPGEVLEEESWRRPRGVRGLSLSVFERFDAYVRTSKGRKAASRVWGISLGVFGGFETCIRTSQGGKATSGESFQHFRDRTGVLEATGKHLVSLWKRRLGAISGRLWWV